MGRTLLTGALLVMLATLSACDKSGDSKSEAAKSIPVKVAAIAAKPVPLPPKPLVGSTEKAAGAADDKNTMPLDPAWTNPTHPDPATGAELDCEVQLGIFDCGALATLAGHLGKTVAKTDVWGAIAMGDDGFWGYSSELPTQKAAEDEAVRQCTLSPGATGCKLTMDVPGYCAALAIGSAHWSASGPTAAVNVAEKDAMQSCSDKDCKIETSFCADGVRHVWPQAGHVSHP
jgi:hypothetical protein